MKGGTKSVIPYRDERPVRARHGMVVSVHHLASDAGVQILRSGGNAVDAAVATGFALAVVHPAAGNLGGGGFLLLRANDGHATFLDFREKAPLAATETMFQDAQGNVIPEESLDSSVLGYRSIATPGSVAGLVYAERKFGKLGLERVMAPAIQLAADGFTLTAEEAKELTDPDLARFPDSKRIFQRDGRLYKDGDTFRQPELARTLQRIAADPDDFYHGKMAHELIDELHKGGALLSALNMLEGYDLAKLGDRTPQSIHLIVEAYRRAYMDRADYLGDPDYNSMPVAQLTSKSFAAAWRVSIRPTSTTPSAGLHRPDGFLPPAPRTAGRRRPESNDTTHYSVVDAEGNAVAVTTTLNDSFGSRVTAGSLGFLLNDEMDDFTVKEGVPNYYGLMQSPANTIAAGKRPLSSMTPTIVLQNGKLRFVLGSPGGARIITTVANIFLSASEGGLNIQQAVDAPRFHHQYLPDKLYLEPGFKPETLDGLRALGYDLEIKDGHWSNGECIAIDPLSGELLGGQDHRSHYGKAAGH